MGKYQETNSFEVYRVANDDFEIEFKCPQCRELLTVDLEDLSQLFEIDCPHCGHTIQCQVKLVMEVVE